MRDRLRPVAFVLLVCAAALLSHAAHAITPSNQTDAAFEMQLAAIAPEFSAAKEAARRELYPIFIFIPGILGSQLTAHKADGSTEIIWGKLSLTTQPDLRIDPQARVEPTVLYELDAFGIAAQIYGQAIERLIRIRLGDRKILLQFPYDWRQDNRLSAAKLNDWLCTNLDQLKGRRVIFLAHSMGGLVLKQWFKQHRNATPCAGGPPADLSITDVAFLGTPHLGAPKAIRAFADGYTLYMDEFAGPLSSVLRDLDKQVLAKSLNAHGALLPSVYQLLPIYGERECVSLGHMTLAQLPPAPLKIREGGAFALFEAAGWEQFAWPQHFPRDIAKKDYYQTFLPETLRSAKALLCDLAKYKFPDAIRVRYYYSNAKDTDVSYVLTKTPLWERLYKPEWSFTHTGDQAKGDGTVTEFVGKYHSAMGNASLEAGSNTFRTVCPESHKDLLKCENVQAFANDVIDEVEQRDALGTKQLLDLNPTIKAAVLKTYADAGVYWPVSAVPGRWDLPDQAVAVELNEEIRRLSGKDYAALVDEAKSVDLPSGRTQALAVVGAMRDVDGEQRAQIAKEIALTQLRIENVDAAKKIADYVSSTADKIQSPVARDEIVNQLMYVDGWSTFAAGKKTQAADILKRLEGKGFPFAFVPPSGNFAVKYEAREFIDQNSKLVIQVDQGGKG